jgi:peptidyl-prolyl cis-trans isomerase A (cyclophilin A)
MHTSRNHRILIVALSAIVGWLPALLGPVAAFAGSAGAVVLSNPDGGEPGSAGQNPGPAGPSRPAPGQAPAAVAPTPAAGHTIAVISTSMGDITIELFDDRAPVSVENFLQYANEGFFTDTIFHRVKPGFMIQGGGLTPTLTEKPTRSPIQNEATNGLRNTRGTVAMARRAQLRSATSQFYINVGDNRSLDHTGYSPDEFGYAVFGRVLSGMDVADRIAAVPTKTSGGMDDVPVEPVIILGVRVQKSSH